VPQDVRRVAYGQAVWSRPLDAGVKLIEMRFRPCGRNAEIDRRRRLTSPRLRGERGAAVNHCAGSAGSFRLTCSDYARLLSCFANEAAGAAGARHSLRPLFSRDEVDVSLGRICAAGMPARVIASVARMSAAICGSTGCRFAHPGYASAMANGRGNPRSRRRLTSVVSFDWPSQQGACRERLAIDRRYRRHQCAVCDRAGWPIRSAPACRGRPVSLVAGCALRLFAGSPGRLPIDQGMRRVPASHK
jgi:hypothetical protein